MRASRTGTKIRGGKSLVRDLGRRLTVAQHTPRMREQCFR